jgi:hypothetical protein
VVLGFGVHFKVPELLFSPTSCKSLKRPPKDARVLIPGAHKQVTPLAQGSATMVGVGILGGGNGLGPSSWAPCTLGVPRK